MSPSEVKLAAAVRSEFGKGAARRIRREHKVPAVLYGHGADTVHVTLPGHETALALRVANALLSIEVDGETEERLALPKQVQRNPLTGLIEHVDLIIVRRGEKVVVDVYVEVVGEAAPETLVVLESSTVTVEAEATHIPTSFEVSVEGAEVGTQILAKDLKLPSGTVLAVDEESLIVNVTSAPVVELESDEDEDAEGAENAEGDGEADGEGADENE